LKKKQIGCSGGRQRWESSLGRWKGNIHDDSISDGVRGMIKRCGDFVREREDWGSVVPGEKYFPL